MDKELNKLQEEQLEDVSGGFLTKPATCRPDYNKIYPITPSIGFDENLKIRKEPAKINLRPLSGGKNNNTANL